MSVDIATYIQYAQVGQFSLANKYAKDAIFSGVNLVPDYISLLRVIRETVENQYALTGETTALDGLANYMYALSGRWNTTIPSPTTTFFIVVQPQSQTITSGDNVTFTVVVAGGVSPYFYQWYLNGNTISGANSYSYTKNNATIADSGVYTVKILDSAGSILTSNPATLIVNSGVIIGSAYFGDTDFFSALSGGTDTVPYQFTFNITHNQPISVPYPGAAEDNKYLVVRVPVGESLKSNWFNTEFNKGVIPDQAWRVPLNPVGLPNYTYYISRTAISNDFNNPLIFS